MRRVWRHGKHARSVECCDGRTEEEYGSMNRATGRDYGLGMEAADESSFAAGEWQCSELGQNDDGYEHRIYQPQ